MHVSCLSHRFHDIRISSGFIRIPPELYNDKFGQARMDEEFRQIKNAGRILGIGESATLKEIKAAYRELSKRYHPDISKESGEKMKEINAAYKLLMDYCESYRFSFRKKEVEDFYSRYMKGFQEDWMWSPVKRKGEQKRHDYRGI